MKKALLVLSTLIFMACSSTPTNSSRTPANNEESDAILQSAARNAFQKIMNQRKLEYDLVSVTNKTALYNSENEQFAQLGMSAKGILSGRLQAFEVKKRGTNIEGVVTCKTDFFLNDYYIKSKSLLIFFYPCKFDNKTIQKDFEYVYFVEGKKDGHPVQGPWDVDLTDAELLQLN